MFQQTLFAGITLVIGLSAQAQSSSCWSESTHPVLKLYAHTENMHLPLLCEELAEPRMYQSEGALYTAALGLTNFVGVRGLFGMAAGAFSKVDQNEWQRDYKRRLMEIQQIPDPLERIRLVYLLVSQTQGYYDHETAGLRNDFVEGWMFWALRPETLLNSAHKYGTAGICRQFAALLYWSLSQVARPPSSQNGTKAAPEFSMKFTSGEVPWDGQMIGHAWIRIRMADKVFDLDTTIFPGTFVPLVPRRTGLKEPLRLKLVQECQELQRCLQQNP